MFRIDMHLHTELGGDSIIQPSTLVPRAREEGLDALCVTEHHDYAISAPLELISNQTGFLIFRALEYKAKEGHLLVYGVNLGRGDLPPLLPMQHVIDRVDTLGGVAVPAHPYQQNMFGSCLGNRLLDLKNLYAIETLNGSASAAENKLAAEAAAQLKTGKLGGSDAHGPNGIGKTFTVFPEPISCMAELVAALKSGNYLPGNRS